MKGKIFKMPYTLVHLKVGSEIAKKYKKYDKPQYYLGLIAPDAVNLNGFAEKDIRWSAHIRAKDLEIWENNIIKYYFENYNNYDNEYILGYLIHVLTDIVFDRMYNPCILNLIHEKKIFENEFENYHNELEKYECSQINEEWWKETVNKLKQSKGININKIDSKEIEMWRDKNINQYSKKQEMKYDIISPELMNNAIIEVEKLLIKHNIL